GPVAPEVLEESFRGSPVTDPDLKKSLARLHETSLRVEAFRKKHPDFDLPKPIPVRPTDDTVDWYLPETGISSQFLSLDPDES
ncbi:MAG: hypothetical protein JNM63_13590, partial [Spirochaetia bacterium]|nr:hypothetical protein [Spirochaetia bacterium]